MSNSATRCKAGDLAWIIKSIRASNLRKIVTVESYVGYFQSMEIIQHNELTFRVPITDHYWWITSTGGLDTLLGPSHKVMCPDTWLEPIKPLKPSDEIYRPIASTVE